jgi:hypothetical protein
MQEVDREFGPLEWRLPEAHAMYWAWVGMKMSPVKEQMPLRRVIYQSMHQTVLRGKLRSVEPFRPGPDLDKAQRANAAYVKMIADDPELREAIQNAHRNFLRELIYLLYSYNKLPEANAFLKYTREQYPGMIPNEMSLDEYALARIKANIAEMSQDRTRAVLTGLIHQHFLSLALDEDGRAEGFDRMARHLWKYWDDRIAIRRGPLEFPPLEEMKRSVLQDMLNPEIGLLTSELSARLRTRLGIPASAPPASQK